MDGFYAGASTLAEQLDKSVLVILRDGRHIVGRLISYDHFGTLVLRGARERHVVSAPPGVAASALLADIDIPGLYVVRGENLTLLAEIDEAADSTNPLLQRGELEEVLRLEVEAAAVADAAASPAGAGLSKALGVNRLPGVAATVPTLWAMGE